MRRRHRRGRLHGAQRRAHARPRRPARAGLRPAAAGRGRLDPQRRHRQRQPAAQLPADGRASSARCVPPPCRPRPRLAREDLAEFITREAIDCDFRADRPLHRRSQRPATTRASRARPICCARSSASRPTPCRATEQRSVLGTDFYHGGMVRNDIGGLHPAKLHRGMLQVAEKAGAVVHGETAVLGFTAEGRRLRGRDGARHGAGRPRHRRHERLHGRRRPAGCAAGWCRCAAASSPPRRCPTI